MSVRSAAEVLNAVKQSNLDPATEAIVTGNDGAVEVPAEHNPREEGGDTNSDALELRARLSIMERMNFDD